MCLITAAHNNISKLASELIVRKTILDDTELRRKDKRRRHPERHSPKCPVHLMYREHILGTKITRLQTVPDNLTGGYCSRDGSTPLIWRISVLLFIIS